MPISTAEDDREQFIWVCPECGRQHQRNNPPCSRCGNGTFEKQPLDYAGVDPDPTPSYLELVGRLEIGGAIVLVGLVIVGVLGLMGVINVPGLTPMGPPTVEDVPGDADTLGSLSLADVEAELVADIDAERTGEPLDRDEGLDGMATYVNQRLVKREFGDADRGLSREQLRRFDTPCSTDASLWSVSLSRAGLGDQSASAVASTIRITPREGPSPTDSTVRHLGVDVHATPAGGLFVTVAYC